MFVKNPILTSWLAPKTLYDMRGEPCPTEIAQDEKEGKTIQ